MAKKIRQRNEIENKYKWDLESMYPNEQKWESDLLSVKDRVRELTGYKGRVGSSAKTLLEVLRLSDSINLTAENVIVYAMMRRDEDNRREKYQAMCDRAMSMFAQLSAQIAFISPELLSHDREEIFGFMDEEPELETYRFELERMFREKDHVLSEKEENLMARFSELTQASSDIFRMINDADIKFGTITDGNGEEVELTHGNYITFMQSKDRAVRKQAYEHCYNTYKSLINTIASTYNYSVKTDCTTAELRHYSSAREAALYGDNIPEAVYDNLVKAVNENLPVMHRYISMRRDLLGTDDLMMYDIYTPLVDVPDRVVPYEEALGIIERALAPLGEDYIRRMKAGFADGWIDVYENEGKSSGAYSFGSYASKPFILCNYNDTLQDVFTVIHEMGHSMNSLYTRETQPFAYGSHSIFTAEVASTVNENLLMKYLIANETDEEMKRYLLNMHLEAFRTTLFRQTMFAEFEHWAHETVESGGQLTAASLCEEYDRLNTKYYGSALTHDGLIKYEWSRIPHFYNAYYVYQYATGYSAAAAISDRIINEYNEIGRPGEAAENYIGFLKSGNSDYPIELLKIAGVDMSSTEPVDNAMKVFAGLVDEFGKLSGR
ncbi:MAG: oligoendopeptidase F [Anaerovoracaceae bacterium]|jgi:oligoendopeptidase F